MEEAHLAQALKDASLGRACIEDSKYTEAADAFGRAVSLCHQSAVTLYAAQASALVSGEKMSDAKNVTESATRHFPKSSLLWYWHGMVSFKLGEKKDALKSFQKASNLESDLSKRTSYLDWAERCKETVGTIDATAQATNDKSIPFQSHGSARTTPIARSSTGATNAAKDSVRMTWYQSASHVNVDIYAKNVVEEESSVAIEDSDLKLRLKSGNADDYVFEKHLFDKVVPQESTWNISRFKFAARLKKANPGITWRSLDQEARIVSAALQAKVDSQRSREASAARDKRWDEFAEGELKGYEEDDSPMGLFRTMYKDADDDVRRAMLKSYSESGGQVLSTNWNEVKQKKVQYKGTD